MIALKRAGAPSDNGVERVPGSPVTLGERPAWVKRSAGRETFEQQGVEAKVPVSFWLRWDAVTQGVTVTDWVEFEGRRFEILSVMEIGRREGIELITVAGD